MNAMITPEWVKDAIFYQIFPDRFAASAKVAKPSGLEPWDSPPTIHGYKGGDLLGVVEKLDYLQELGITALYFNPIFQSASNHRYHTHDYYRVDPLLGGDDALRELLDAAHQRDMKVVLDGVFNHASRGLLQFNDILENGSYSAYLDWFHIHKLPLNAYGGPGGLGYEAWWGLPALPKFNTRTPAVREFLWEVASYWLKFGIDGWRLDVPNEIADDAFWQEFRRRCRAVNPECYLVGEIWDGADRWLQGDQFDAVMNYPFTRAVFGFTAPETLNSEEIKRCGYQHIPPLSARGFAAQLEQLLQRYRPEVTAVQLNLLGSHDTPRALTVVGEDERALRMSLVMLMAFPGAPCIYYGDELGLTGTHDPFCRQTMPWEAPQAWNHELLAFTKQLIALRKKQVALRRGRFELLYADKGLVVFARVHEQERVIGILNANKQQHKLELHLATKRFAGRYRDLLNGLSIDIRDTHLTGHDIPARSAALLVPNLNS